MIAIEVILGTMSMAIFVILSIYVAFDVLPMLYLTIQTWLSLPKIKNPAPSQVFAQQTVDRKEYGYGLGSASGHGFASGGRNMGLYGLGKSVAHPPSERGDHDVIRDNLNEYYDAWCESNRELKALEDRFRSLQESHAKLREQIVYYKTMEDRMHEALDALDHANEKRGETLELLDESIDRINELRSRVYELEDRLRLAAGKHAEWDENLPGF